MKTILVPVAGSLTDRAVFETALTVARSETAHLNFLHVRLHASSAALHTPHMSYAVGASLREALKDLELQTQKRLSSATRNVQEFCNRHGIAMVDKPGLFNAATARWRVEEGEALQRLIVHARHNDLVVMARPAQSHGLPPDRLEALLFQCGRPLLIVPKDRGTPALDTTVICWKETPDAARALSVAMPLLRLARRVIIVTVREGQNPEPGAVEDLAEQLAWHGLSPELQVLPRDGQSTVEVLFSRAQQLRADLMIMGGYGHSRAREIIFGGCTQAAIEAAEIPVLLMH
jgi:nucleotide-binding universal stress UspA family protein